MERVESRGGGWVRIVAAVAVGLVSAYFMVTNTFALSIRNGPIAVQVAPWNGVAIGRMAEALIQSSKSNADAAGVSAEARHALRREPMDFRAARSLAATAGHTGDIRTSRAIFAAVGKATLREPVTHVWLLSDAFNNKRWSEVVRESEVLLRQNPQMAGQVYPFLTHLVDNRLATGDLVSRLAAMPSWRTTFFDAIGERSQNSDAGFAFLSRVAASGHPADSSELRVWLSHEVQRTGGDELVRRWHYLQRPPLPARERYLRNGDFESSAAPQPFDWTFFLPEGSFAEIGPSPTGQGKAMFVEMIGREDVAVASQILDLTPGSYELSAKIYPVSDTSRRESGFELHCAQGKNYTPTVRQVIAGPSDTWSTLRWRFRVPEGCRTQRLWVGMKPGALATEQRIYFDDMAIKPVASAKP